MGKLVYAGLLVLAISAVGFVEAKNQVSSVRPVVDNWKCPSCEWDNTETETHCKICGRCK